jgi:hypothetical protein
MTSLPFVSFRPVFAFALGVATFCASLAAEPIDRHAVVSRHNVSNTRLDAESALTIGNGDFAMTVDATGLQTFERLYYDNGLPLETRTTWAWHEFPNVEHLTLADAMVSYNFHGRKIDFPGKQQSPAGKYFRENPQPMPLGQISFVLNGEALRTEDVSAINQMLDLWSGVVTSRFKVAGESVEVLTAAHGTGAVVGVQVSSPLVQRGLLQVRFRFPYAYNVAIAHKPPFVWDQPDKHRTTLTQPAMDHARIERSSDTTRYIADVRWTGQAALREVAPHDLRLRATAGDTLAFTCAFSDAEHPAPAAGFGETRAASETAWRDYWTKGGIIDLAGSTDRRAAELERRTILSLYLVKVNYAGDFPPAETGLQHLTWFGKHNSEVYFWHAAQFYQWGHPELIEKGLSWYAKILPRGKAYAAAEGFDGVRWPKMAGIDGRPSPGSINPFIIWNQPNPIYLSELVYRAKPNRATLEKYREIVFESAKFLASFAYYDQATDRYILGPPIKNVSESNLENNTQNPTFELAFWYYGLQLAQQWRERLGEPREPKWDDILQKISRLPQRDGRYLEIETVTKIYEGKGGLPTSMLLAFGYLPQTPLVDVETMRRTFHSVNERNGLERWTSWAMGQGALTAARLGEPETAVAIVTNQAAPARFMPSGYVRRPKDPDGAVAYLPVNGALLCAVGLMAGGWDGAPPQPAPGFPPGSAWKIRVEGLNPLP